MTDPPQQVPDRDDIITALRALVAELATRSQPARIRIISGAAIALTIAADRAATVDIDAPLEPADTVRAAALAVAARYGWRADWLNDAAAVFIPTGYGTRSPGWRTVHDHDGIRIQVADPATLLAMKLHAANRRGNRDAADPALLLPACGITTVQDAAELYDGYYPGDELTDRTSLLITRLLQQVAAVPAQPDLPNLG